MVESPGLVTACAGSHAQNSVPGESDRPTSRGGVAELYGTDRVESASIVVDDDTPDDERGMWESPGMAAVLSYVEYLPQRVANRIQALTTHYRLDREGQRRIPFATLNGNEAL